MAMSKKKVEMLTTRQFAGRKGINYRTALNWLAAGLVPGANLKQSPLGEYWEIPSTALAMDRPKPGPKKTTVPPHEKKPAKKRASKKAPV
jgi:hypothetical protein